MTTDPTPGGALPVDALLLFLGDAIAQGTREVTLDDLCKAVEAKRTAPSRSCDSRASGAGVEEAARALLAAADKAVSLWGMEGSLDALQGAAEKYRAALSRAPQPPQREAGEPVAYRIRVGALVMQDHRFFNWPGEYADRADTAFMFDTPTMFDTPSHTGMRAYGFGLNPGNGSAYGSGAVYVAKADLIPLYASLPRGEIAQPPAGAGPDSEGR